METGVTGVGKGSVRTGKVYDNIEGLEEDKVSLGLSGGTESLQWKRTYGLLRG